MAPRSEKPGGQLCPQIIREQPLQIYIHKCWCLDYSGNSRITFQSAKQKELNLTNRKISNYLTILNQYGKTLGFPEEVKYIEAEFGKYKQTIGDHIADLEYLSKTEPEFRKIAENIDTKCEAIILKFYLS